MARNVGGHDRIPSDPAIYRHFPNGDHQRSLSELITGQTNEGRHQAEHRLGSRRTQGPPPLFIRSRAQHIPASNRPGHKGHVQESRPDDAPHPAHLERHQERPSATRHRIVDRHDDDVGPRSTTPPPLGGTPLSVVVGGERHYRRHNRRSPSQPRTSAIAVLCPQHRSTLGPAAAMDEADDIDGDGLLHGAGFWRRLGFAMVSPNNFFSKGSWTPSLSGEYYTQ